MQYKRKENNTDWKGRSKTLFIGGMLVYVEKSQKINQENLGTNKQL